jgi:hypothetical protein
MEVPPRRPQTASVMPGTWIGLGTFGPPVVPWPSWHTSLAPQTQTVPSDLAMMEWRSPTAIETTPVNPETLVGVGLKPPVVPWPSCPWTL